MLELLFKKSYSMNELMDALSEVTGERCSNFLVCKYINTCRFCGIDIQKINGKYMLLRLPFGMDFSDDELDLINEINEYCQTARITKTIRGINSILDKLNRRSNKYYSRIALPEEDHFIENFENALEKGVKVKISYNDNGTSTTGEWDPVSISCEDSLISFILKNKDSQKKIYYTDVTSLEISTCKSNNGVPPSSIVFKLKNNLAKRYTLRPDERIVSTDFDGSICVSNKAEDKDTLLKRLLKYGDMCEIVSPRSYRKEFKNTIINTLKNYGIN